MTIQPGQEYEYFGQDGREHILITEGMTEEGLHRALYTGEDGESWPSDFCENDISEGDWKLISSPKFKVGDVITRGATNDGDGLIITGIEDDKYLMRWNNGEHINLRSVKYVEKHYRLLGSAKTEVEFPPPQPQYHETTFTVKHKYAVGDRIQRVIGTLTETLEISEVNLDSYTLDDDRIYKINEVDNDGEWLLAPPPPTIISDRYIAIYENGHTEFWVSPPSAYLPNIECMLKISGTVSSPQIETIYAK